MLAFLRSLFARGPVEAPTAPAQERPGAIPVLAHGEAPAAPPSAPQAGKLHFGGVPSPVTYVVGDQPSTLMAPAKGPPSLTARDMERLRGVHPDLVRVVKRARSRVAFFVAEGLRTHDRQRQLVAEGKSKTLNSRHLTGHAVDLYPVSDIPIPKMKLPDFKELVDAMRWAAAVEGVPIVCGFDWGWDAPHYELPRASYPA